MGDLSLEEEVGHLLRSLNLTIALAESCTGGLICHRLTNVSGSSDYLEMGVVCYSNRSKTAFLAVPERVIKEHGAVSEACVRAMAKGIREVAQTRLGFSVSGIAGPTGGTPDKPIGTVHMALAWNDGVECWEFLFTGHREQIKEKAAEEALKRIRDHCLGIRDG